MRKKKVWSQLRALATSDTGTEEGETERGMAIAALSAAYRFLLRKKGKRGRGVGESSRRGKMSMDKKDSP